MFIRQTARNHVAAAVLLLLIGLSWSFAQPAAAQTQVEPCPRIPLSPGPSWTISGTITSDGRNLLLIDTANDKILRYPIGGGTPQMSIAAAEAARLENFFPKRMVTRGNGEMLLELANGRLVTLDRGYVPLRRKNVLAEGIRNGEQVISMFGWDIVGDDEVISLSDLKGPGPTERRSAFLRIPFDDPSGFTILKPLPLDGSRNIFRLGYDVTASLGTTAYVLLFDNGVRVYRNDKGTPDLMPLSAFPRGFDIVPILPRYTDLDDFPIVMAAMEKTAMAVGLYGWQGNLWVLTRRPDGKGKGTRWELTRIDPERDQVLGTAVIPTQANHLTAVPGPLGWAFVEKGPVRAFGKQDIKTYLYVPASRISRIGNGASGDICQ